MTGIIAAITLDRVIGVYNKDNSIGYIPWKNYPNFIMPDMIFFRKMTENSNVIMGRKTWESINSKPLVNRNNIIISRKELSGTHYRSFKSISEAINFPLIGDVWFIGGREIYLEALNIIDEIYLTVVPLLSKDIIKQRKVKVFFPPINESVFYRECFCHPQNNDMLVLKYVRK